MKFYWNVGNEIQIQFGPKVRYSLPQNRYFVFTVRKFNLSFSRNTCRFYFTNHDKK